MSLNNFFDVKHGDVFKVEDLVYHYDSNSFQVFFNRKIDPKTIDNTGRTIAFFYKNKKLDIKEISYLNPMTLKIKLYPFTDHIDRNAIENDMAYAIQRVRDLKGNVINEGPVLTLKQFREIFVQEVIEHLDIDTTFNFIQKNKVLSASEVNKENEFKKYWINSPLKESK